MTFYKNLYLGEGVRKDANKIVKKIKQNKVVPGVYVITYAFISSDLLDLIPAWELTQKGYPKEGMEIIGLAQNKKEAMEIAQIIIDEVYRNTGGFCVREYFLLKQEEQI